MFLENVFEKWRTKGPKDCAQLGKFVSSCGFCFATQSRHNAVDALGCGLDIKPLNVFSEDCVGFEAPGARVRASLLNELFDNCLELSSGRPTSHCGYWTLSLISQNYLSMDGLECGIENRNCSNARFENCVRACRTIRF